MWRFALRSTDAARCSKQLFIANGVEEDSEFGSLVRAHERGQTVFVVRESSSPNIREALHFLLGLCTCAPNGWTVKKYVGTTPALRKNVTPALLIISG